MTDTQHHTENLHHEIAGALKTIRILAGMTQQKLAKSTGVTYQQIQKYENGQSAISSTKLCAILLVFGITHDQFFHHVPSFPSAASRKNKCDTTNPVADEATLKICRRLMTVSDPAYKNKIKDAVFCLTG